MKILNNLISLFYPRMCAACGNVLQQNESFICIECMLHLPETDYHKEHLNPLRQIFDGRVKVEEVAALMTYKKSTHVQKILHNFKYKGQKEIGFVLGKYYGEQLVLEERYRNIDCVIPIPLHKKKLRKRGYNQSEWIAKGLAQSMKIPYVSDVLLREHYNETQTKKGKFARWMNVKEVFTVQNSSLIEGKHVLVCDDVLTTGATMEAALRKIQSVAGVRTSVVTLAATL